MACFVLDPRVNRRAFMTKFASSVAPKLPSSGLVGSQPSPKLSSSRRYCFSGRSTQKNTFIGGISGKTVANGVGVIIISTGQLGTIQSSARYKEAIKPMDKASEGLLALKPKHHPFLFCAGSTGV